ncbi:MAG: hypothetical protein QY871_02730 [Dehalococcoides mccartyi]|nr:hypothetical protein [Dehalococcoides mccartyi]MDN4185974.1 hypothetical protein [Dehalococcoides mccartyi]
MKEPSKNPLTRQERREEKLENRRRKMTQHGKGLAKVYKDAVEKKTKQKP